MKTDNKAAQRAGRIYLRADDCRLEDLAALTRQETRLVGLPLRSVGREERAHL